MMRRRDFTESGTTAEARELGGCASEQIGSTHQQRVVSIGRELEEAINVDVARMEQEMQQIANTEIIPGIEPLSLIGERVRVATHALYLSSRFRDLPLERQRHPRLQRKMIDEIDVFDEAIFGTGSYVRNSGLLTDYRVVAALGKRRNLGLLAVDQIARLAMRLDMSLPYRLRLRAIGSEIMRDMRQKSPLTAFEGYWSKIEQLQRQVERANSPKRLNSLSAGGRPSQQRPAPDQSQKSFVRRYWQNQLLSTYTQNTVIQLTSEVINPGAWTLGIGAEETGTQVVTINGSCTDTPGAYLIIASIIVLTVGVAVESS